MINANTFASLAQAYRETLCDILEHGHPVPSVVDPTSPGSDFGQARRPSLELVGYSFQIDDPLSCLFRANARVIRLPYCIGQFLWTVAGSDSVDWIKYYNPAASTYSGDGRHLPGSFGKRLFSFEGGVDQIDAICRLITRDPASRRTFGAICTPRDNASFALDYPCCIGIQYFLRDGLLDAITYMRSQSALGVLPYDAFLFMALQCLVASRLGVKLGHYRHITGSLHIYEDEVARARQVVSQPIRPVQLGEFSGTDGDFNALLVFEAALRTSVHAKDVRRVERMASHASQGGTFYEESQTILLLHALLTLHERDTALKLLNRLPPSMAMLGRSYSEIVL